MKKGMWWMGLLGLILIIAACGSGSSGTEESGGEAGEQQSGETKESSGNEEAAAGNSSEADLEIFSWWTGAGEEAGLNALIDLFQEKHPDITVENAAVAGGAGTNAKAVLATRMQGNDPPSTFQVHAGAELNESWVAADKMEPLNDFYEEEGLMDKFPQELIDMVSQNRNIYSVPVNIHRGNVIFYNMSVFEEHGLEPPKTFEEFMEVADELQAAGVTPLALGDKETWPATQIFENILLGTLGPEDYQALWDGDIAFDDERVVEAAETFKQMLGYVNEDHASRNWQDSAQLVSEGKAAMINMGDWAKGYFSNDLEMEVNEDFGYFTFPETEGNFMVISDTFGLPSGVENEDQVKEFLALLGSVEGQDTFNPLKGSIPARVDADESNYDEYGTDTIEDFREASLAPSLAHGSAASEGYLTKANQAVNIFVTQGDTNRLLQSLENARSAQ
ncbi:glucose/mannose transport system substrate-binding protein [Salibacterium halotolerans]|uniref:Probable sugar-binding periplasmic protein n=2 Tax=Salibacterium halotolerans TaxID=1884432 RepID=A0A1I5LJ83_9BACI|nr:ABC transporter substrate-binding protein [Salibacterium halotolerans]SFO97378.1 glucose/mannose transport system substrate-binding protein [Salibacterium halotolerans]